MAAQAVTPGGGVQRTPSRIDYTQEKERGQGGTFFLNLNEGSPPVSETMVFVLGGLYAVPYPGSYMGEFPMAELIVVVRGVASITPAHEGGAAAAAVAPAVVENGPHAAADTAAKDAPASGSDDGAAEAPAETPTSTAATPAETPASAAAAAAAAVDDGDRVSTTVRIPEEVKAALRAAGAPETVDFFFVVSSVEHIISSKKLYKKKSILTAGLNLVHHAWAYPDAEYGKRTGASASMGIFVYDEYAGVTPTTPNADMAFQRLTKKTISIHPHKQGGMCCSPNNGRFRIGHRDVGRGADGGGGGGGGTGGTDGGGGGGGGGGGDVAGAEITSDFASADSSASRAATKEPDASGKSHPGVCWFWSACVTNEGKACATLQLLLPRRIPAVDTAAAKSNTLGEMLDNVCAASTDTRRCTGEGGAEAGLGVQAALHRTFGVHGGGVAHQQQAEPALYGEPTADPKRQKQSGKGKKGGGGGGSKGKGKGTGASNDTRR